MKKLIKIMSNIPCYLKANNQSFYIETSKILEVIDEEEIFLSAFPATMSEYFPIYYTLRQKLVESKNIRITKYRNNIKLELFFSSANKVKQFEKEDYKISYYNHYTLSYKNNMPIAIKSFKNNYYRLEVEELNDKYSIIKGFYKLKENSDYGPYNQKISICVFNKNNNSIVYTDNCNKTEINNDTLKIISLMFDQNKQALIGEFYINNNDFSKKDFYSSYTKGQPESLNKRYQISQAFFECILANNYKLVSNYLTDDLKGKIFDKDLRAMFNNFIKVDNEFLQNTDEINLISRLSEGIFEAKTYKVEYSNNKISNILSIF